MRYHIQRNPTCKIYLCFISRKLKTLRQPTLWRWARSSCALRAVSGLCPVTRYRETAADWNQPTTGTARDGELRAFKPLFLALSYLPFICILLCLFVYLINLLFLAFILSFISQILIIPLFHIFSITIFYFNHNLFYLYFIWSIFYFILSNVKNLFPNSSRYLWKIGKIPNTYVEYVIIVKKWNNDFS